MTSIAITIFRKEITIWRVIKKKPIYKPDTKNKGKRLKALYALAIAKLKKQ